jgi:ribonuclease D
LTATGETVSTPAPATPRVVESDDGVLAVAADAARAPLVALDVEASGMHAYRARVCTIQLAWDDARLVVVVDALAASIAPLSDLLGASGPTKIVHDVAFDARLFAESGLRLGRVHDTAIAARMLGRRATGLASLLGSELGLHVDKDLQHHDWRVRPLDDAMIVYLGEDVRHLEALHRALWSEVVETGIEEAVVEETDYRIACAVTAATQERPDVPAYLRMKGACRLGERELAALRVLVALREREAERRDVPAYDVAAHHTLLAMASSRPTTLGELGRIRGTSISSSSAAHSFFRDAVEALAAAGDTLPDDERLLVHPERPAPSVVRARRDRETRLLAWRRAEAARRSVDEQVVLPGHCVKVASSGEIASIDDLSRVPGIGAFRIRRDGEAMLGALLGDGSAA